MEIVRVVELPVTFGGLAPNQTRRAMFFSSATAVVVQHLGTVL